MAALCIADADILCCMWFHHHQHQVYLFKQHFTTNSEIAVKQEQPLKKLLQLPNNEYSN